jgi:hypothetical protein
MWPRPEYMSLLHQAAALEQEMLNHFGHMHLGQKGEATAPITKRYLLIAE